MIRRLLFSLPVLCLLWAPAVQAALILENVPRWGFDGRVRLGTFNLLTVEFANNSDQPWEGSLRLTSSGPVGGGMPIIHPDLYVEGGGRRRLQFLIYLESTEEFNLVWGRSPDDRVLIDRPNSSGQPAVVQLSTDRQIATTSAGMPRFYESDFPPNAAGLKSLGEVHLDHVPPWTEAQMRAFRDWLAAGGEVHIYPRGQRMPEFTGLLSGLNEPSDRFPIGSGTVFRHETALSGAESFRRGQQGEGMQYGDRIPTEAIFRSLRETTQPVHNWPLIYLMAIIYLLILFPGCWLLGRKRGDYRVTYGAILGVVALFSYGFNRVGARGYGESTTIHSVALVTPASEDRAAVTQWTNLFVTSGAEYDITHPLEGVAYSPGEAHERVPGTIINRPVGRMITEIPSFSARTLVHTGMAQQIAPRGKVVDFQVSGDRLASCEIELEFPVLADDDPFTGYILFGRQMYGVARTGQRLRLGGSVQTVEALINENNWYGTNMYGYQYRSSDQVHISPDLIYSNIPAPLIAQDLGIRHSQEVPQFSLPEREIRLYLYTPIPESLHADLKVSLVQNGRAMFALPLRLEKPPAVADQPAPEAPPEENAAADEPLSPETAAE